MNRSDVFTDRGPLVVVEDAEPSRLMRLVGHRRRSQAGAGERGGVDGGKGRVRRSHRRKLSERPVVTDRPRLSLESGVCEAHEVGLATCDHAIGSALVMRHPPSARETRGAIG